MGLAHNFCISGWVVRGGHFNLNYFKFKLFRIFYLQSKLKLHIEDLLVFASCADGRDIGICVSKMGQKISLVYLGIWLLRQHMGVSFPPILVRIKAINFITCKP